MTPKKIMYVGIDPGVSTGVAAIVDGEYTHIHTYDIIEAMDWIRIHHGLDTWEILLHVENPSFRRYFGQSGREKLQGAGSIKRDYSIWVTFAEHLRIRIFPIAPAEIGSDFDNVAIFRAATGYAGRTPSKHARDAAKIILKFKK